MAKIKKHKWRSDKTLAGVEYCINCDMTKINIKGGKSIMYRQGGIIDNSTTKHNCFKLSKI